MSIEDAVKWGAAGLGAFISGLGLSSVNKARKADRTAEILRRLDALETEVANLQSDVFAGQNRDEHVKNDITLILRAINGIRALLENPPARELPRD